MKKKGKKTPLKGEASNFMQLDGVNNRKRVDPATRAKRYLETGDSKELGVGATRAMAKMYLPADKDLDDDEVKTLPAYYRKPKGFTPEHQAKRQQLIREIQELTGNPNYDGMARRTIEEMESHRWHSAKGGARPAEYCKKFSPSA